MDLVQSILTRDEVIWLQNKWSYSIVNIGLAYIEGGDYKEVTLNMINDMYAYHEGEVLFKPTKATRVQFRDSQELAFSYFVGGLIKEDHGFALKPWSNVYFNNHQIIIERQLAFAMGNYYFIDANNGEEVKAEFTIAIKRAVDGRPVIFLHHSSLPYDSDKNEINIS